MPEQTMGGSGTQVVNEPKPINILAYCMGGSLLLSAVGSIYYTRSRVKQACNGSK